MGETKQENREMDPAILYGVGMARHIQNFMHAIQIIKDNKVKRVEFNATTSIYRVGEIARIDMKAPLDPEKLAELPAEAIFIPEHVTAEDLDNAAKVGTQLTNFMESIQMVKDGKVKRIDFNDNTMIYRVVDLVRIDIKAPKR